MTSIQSIIAAASPQIPFSYNAAERFLSQLNVSDQAALISALYIGRDHLHDDEIQPEYVPEGISFDRYFHTGCQASGWFIDPSSFPDILYEKNTNLKPYLDAFLRCAASSGYDLSKF